MKRNDGDVYIRTGIIYLQMCYTVDICIAQSRPELSFISGISELQPMDQIWPPLDFVNRFLLAKPRPFIDTLSVTAPLLQFHSWVVLVQTLSTKPKIFVVWYFTKKCVQHQFIFYLRAYKGFSLERPRLFLTVPWQRAGKITHLRVWMCK